MNSVAPFIPDNAPFSTDQRAWLNGYLAGMFSRQPVDMGAGLGMGEAPDAAPPKQVSVVFGSQTGTAEGVARESADRLGSIGCKPTVFDMDDYDVSKLADEEHLLVICSTYGDGEMPDNAQAFWDALSADDAPTLSKTQFTVLALGDTNYETFCTAGAMIDERLEALGGTRMHPRIDCDVDFEEPFEVWMSGVNTALAASSEATPAAPTKAADTGWGKKNPYPAKLSVNRRLSHDDSSKETRHYEILLGDSGIEYQVGDALQVIPTNDPALVDAICAALQTDGAEEVICADGQLAPLREALLNSYEIQTPSKDFLAAIVERSGDPQLAGCIADEAYMYGRDLLDFLQEYSACSFSADEFVVLLKKLQPRAYSISSSLAKHPGEVHLTIASVRYEANARAKAGVCSCFLADRVADDTPVHIYVHANKAFSVPADPSAPMIMVGPGTGVAPFRAFLEEREATKAPGKNWLFFGDRNAATDFLYEDELEAMQESGVLNRLDLAFSRDQDEKIYVQDRMREAGSELFAWLEEGGYFFVCGDAYRMAKDVDAALHAVIAEHGSLSEDEAAAYVSKLKKEKRYVRDVY